MAASLKKLWRCFMNFHRPFMKCSRIFSAWFDQGWKWNKYNNQSHTKITYLNYDTDVSIYNEKLRQYCIINSSRFLVFTAFSVPSTKWSWLSVFGVVASCVLCYFIVWDKNFVRTLKVMKQTLSFHCSKFMIHVTDTSFVLSTAFCCVFLYFINIT